MLNAVINSFLRFKLICIGYYPLVGVYNPLSLTFPAVSTFIDEAKQVFFGRLHRYTCTLIVVFASFLLLDDLDRGPVVSSAALRHNIALSLTDATHRSASSSLVLSSAYSMLQLRIQCEVWLHFTRSVVSRIAVYKRISDNE